MGQNIVSSRNPEATLTVRRDQGRIKVVVDALDAAAVRTAVMGADASVRKWPTAAELAEMQRLVAEAMKAGAVDFLTKPFSPKRLYARAAELVGLPDDAAAESA